jgi:predicted DNA-binding transcriptional regulator AlpA
MSEMNARLLTSAEVAKLFKVNTSTVCRWWLDGVGPSFVRIGLVYRYPVDLLDEWITTHLRQDMVGT